MPKTSNQLPSIGDQIKFRIVGDKHLHEGTYTEEGFKACTGFICYTTCEVDYWRAFPVSVGGRTE